MLLLIHVETGTSWLNGPERVRGEVQSERGISPELGEHGYMLSIGDQCEDLLGLQVPGRLSREVC
jgi:hypothetical protein